MEERFVFYVGKLHKKPDVDVSRIKPFIVRHFVLYIVVFMLLILLSGVVRDVEALQQHSSTIALIAVGLLFARNAYRGFILPMTQSISSISFDDKAMYIYDMQGVVKGVFKEGIEKVVFSSTSYGHAVMTVQATDGILWGYIADNVEHRYAGYSDVVSFGRHLVEWSQGMFPITVKRGLRGRDRSGLGDIETYADAMEVLKRAEGPGTVH